ncbi:hypothetical protein POM88_038552 [Heracleum sosnowskyi]|uniref:HECT-type E3 ubiquitin transferase n=1 Tax=Heracleum sosnowskyi TaxID=360622 RepID=A0AAD8H9T1_9APIA|nr:hypothetical protein POM88_038552 [Heracleum sosnowskyi]
MDKLRDLEDQLEKVAISGEGVTNQTLSEQLLKDLLMIVKHPTFISFFANRKIFNFSFGYLDKLIQADDPDDYMRVLQILSLLPKDDVTSQQFQRCMFNNVDFFAMKLGFVVRQEHEWILETGYEFRVKLAYHSIPILHNTDQQLKLEINRENLVQDSITKILEADEFDLRRGISVRFVGEAGIGDGVRRDWLISLVGKMVETQDAFQTSGGDLAPDHTRIYPKQGSSASADFYRCFGRLIVLALIHNIQVGITFDNILFLQLSEKKITLEDIRATDPAKYKSYNEIMRSSPQSYDEEYYYFSDGSDHSDDDEGGRVVPLEDREKYVAGKIQKEFVSSIQAQTDNILKGFDGLLSVFRIVIFQILKLEDFDYLIRGIKELKMEDWKKFTRYEQGYEANDRQIKWFWQCVQDLPEEKRRKLLYNWTGIKYLPRGGFEALRPPVVIRNWPQDKELLDDLPRAQTCFHRLSFPRFIFLISISLRAS